MQPYTEDFFKGQQEGSRRSALEILPLVLTLIHPRRVIDVGCGVGTWLAALRNLGIEDVWGVDGDYVARSLLHIPAERFIPHDLTKPLRLENEFDLAISVEVAEHLPAACAGDFIDSLTRLAPIVLFSAAIPFSRGLHHLNEQWPEYWVAHFQARDFVAVDCLRRRIWQNDLVEWWYAQNILLFVRRDHLDRHPPLQRELEINGPVPLALIHPKNFLATNQYLAAVSDPRNISLRWVLRVVPVLIKNALKRRLKRIYSRFAPDGRA
ncbi:MAG: class I SAM-dependent methyltransferase [Verrucomicrobiota bacterium]